MCVSSAPARLTDTKVYAGFATVDGKVVHVNAYQNTALNLSSGPNSMILPVPSITMLRPENLLDTSRCKDVLSDMAKAIQPATRGGIVLRGGYNSGAAPLVFSHDIYTIISADDPLDVPSVLGQVSVEKRPNIDPALLQAYHDWYPGWRILVCCFNNRDAQGANPFLWWYDPILPDTLFAPGLDCHTGKVPDLNELVDRDHAVIFGGDDTVRGNSALYSHWLVSDAKALPVDRYLPRKVGGRTLSTTEGYNGDFYMTVPGLRGSTEQMHVIPPPGSKEAREDEDWPMVAGFAW